MRIYPSTPIPQNSMLIRGDTLNKTMKQLANPDVDVFASSYFTDTNIKHIKRTYDSPGVNISEIKNVALTQCIPIYAWFDFNNSTLYLKSECNKIFLNDYATSSFENMESLQDIDFVFYTTHKCTSLNRLFSNANSLLSVDVSKLNTQNVNNMEYMFAGCSSLTHLDLSNWNTSNVKNMQQLFYGCGSLSSLDVSMLDTSSVVYMNSTFSKLNLDVLDLTNFNTSNVKNIGSTFEGSNITNIIGFENLDMSSAITASNMFSKCTTSSVTLPNFCNDKLNSFSTMFYSSNIPYINMEKVTAKNINDISSAFSYSKEIIDIYLPLVPMKLDAITSAFINCSSLKKIHNISSMDISNITSIRSMFSGCSSLASLNLSSWDVSKVTDMRQLFNGCSSLTSLDLSSWDVSKVTDMYQMFYNCNKLITLNMHTWTTSSVTNITGMFSGCSSLTSLNLSKWNTSKVTNMNNVFYDCSSLTSLDLSNFDTSNVTGINNIFRNCSSLISLDLSNFDTSNVTYMQYVFMNCVKLDSIFYGNNFNINDKILKLSISDGSNNLTCKMYNNCPANKPMHKSWTMNGRWTTTGTFYKKSILIQGSDIRKLILDTTEHVVCMQQMNGSSVDITLEKDGRARIFYDTRSTNTINISHYYYSFSIILNEDCSGMFKNLPDLVDVDLSHNYFNYNEVVTNNWKEMFANDPKLTSVKYPANFDMTEEVYLTTKANDDTNPTWHMFYNSPNAPKPTGGWWDYGTWNDEGTFIKGADIDIMKFRSAFTSHSSTMTAFKKSDVPPANMVDVFDVSKDENMAIMSWYDTTANIQYYYSENPMVFMDTDSTSMFELPSSNVCKSIDLSGLDTRKVTNMNRMFYSCNKLISLDLSSFNTSNVENMGSMFDNCSLPVLDLSNFNTSNVIDMQAMFSGCSSSLNLSSFNTSNVVSMNNMFSRYSSLTSLDISSFDTSNVTNMSGMFYYCRKLSSLDLSNFDTAKVTNMNSMFEWCTKLSSLNLSNFNTSNVTTMSGMFSGCESLTSLNLSHFNMIKCRDISRMFVNCMKLDLCGFENWDVSNLETMTFAFNRCELIESIDLSNWNTPKLVSMDVVFANCTALKTLNLSNFNTSKVKNMRALVSNCPMLESLDLSSFDTSSVEYSGEYSGMSNMFSNATSLSTIIFSDKFVITDQLYNRTTNNNSYNPLYGIYSNCSANKPTGGNWDLGTWTDDGTFIKNT